MLARGTLIREHGLLWDSRALSPHHPALWLAAPILLELRVLGSRTTLASLNLIHHSGDKELS